MRDRIVIICRRFCPGEAWTNRILGYAKGFAEQRYDVILVYLITDKKRTPYEINIPGVSVLNVWERNVVPIKYSRHLSLLFNLIKIRRLLRDGDKVFLYGYEPYIIDTVLSVKRSINVYGEITEHPFKDSNMEEDFSLDPKYKRRLSRLDGLFVISNSLKKYYEKNDILNGKIYISNMFVDFDRFSNIIKKKNKSSYIAYCGILSEHKDGVDILIKSFSKISNKYPQLKLLLIGRGESEYVITKLKEFVHKLNLQDKVIFTGKVPPEEMPQLLNDAQILALARPNNIQSQNGFPTKLGEYLCTGNPVVVTKVGEIPLFLKDGYNAILAEPDSIESFAEKMDWCLSHEMESKSIGMRGKALALDQFSYKTQSKLVLSKMFGYEI